MFTARDDANAPRVALVNEAFARRYFAGGSAIGQRLTFDGDTPTEIVGIVSNTMNSDLDDPAEPGVYQPFAQRPGLRGRLLYGDPVATAPDVFEQ